MIIIIIAVYLILQEFGFLNLLAPPALTGADIGYWLMFVIGLTTSAHCAAVCGGINLSQCIKKAGTITDNANTSNVFFILRPSILYNLGRITSYAIMGLAAGALGSAVMFSVTARSGLKLIAGLFIVTCGMNILGLFPQPRKFIHEALKFFTGKLNLTKHKKNTPIITGLLNGLMPCAPLYAAQIYALSTGNPVKGSISMIFFGLGTVPLMFGLGVFGSAISKKASQRVITTGGAAVVILGLCMLSQSWNLYSISTFPKSRTTRGNNLTFGITLDTEPQILNTTLTPYGYPSIKAEIGKPVEWIIYAPPGSINACNNRFIIKEYGIEHELKPGKNIIEFTPGRTGSFPYTCWTGAIRGTITVTASEKEGIPRKEREQGERCC
ncbi:MAG: sulfite exporter TauE/SafE family protein [Chitinispirillales bacterium]|nr:sulfite exporter TauE/SafE family protein [Chitinispirillales bacterium]